MQGKRGALAMILLALAACASPGTPPANGNAPAPVAATDSLRGYHPEVKVDEFTKARTVDLEVRNWLRAERARCTHVRSAFIGLSVRKYTDREQKTTLLLSTLYHANEWLFGGDELQLLLGDSLHTLTATGAPQTRVSSGVYEQQSFMVTPDDLRAIAAAPAAKVRLSGRNGKCDFTIPPDGQRLLGVFVSRELANIP